MALTLVTQPTVRLRGQPEGTGRRLRSEWPIFLLLMVAAGVITGWGLRDFPALGVDEGTYTNQAWAVLHGHIQPYTYSYDHPFIGWTLLSPLAWVAQVSHISGSSLSVVDTRAAMVLYAAVDSLLIYLVARRLDFTIVLAALAVLLWAFSPLTIDYSRAVYLDNMALPWVLASLLLALDVQRRQWRYIACGACFALAAVSKETTLLLFPVILYVVYQRTAHQLRTIALVSATSAGLLLMGIYPLLASLRDELVPGKGHVSLWTQGIAYQLFNRAGSGAIWQKDSERSVLLSGWLGYDKVLIYGGLAAACIIVFVHNLRPIALAIAVGALTVLKPGGYLPAMYVIVSLPFLALAVAAVPSALYRGGQARLHLSRRLSRALALVVTLVILAVAVPAYVRGDRSELRSDPVAPYAATEKWVVVHVPRSDYVLTDDDFWLDLVDHGFGEPWHGAISYYHFDLDSSSTKRLPRGWRELNYVIETPQMRLDVTSSGLALPGTTAAIAHSRVVATFGTGGAAILVRKIVGV